MTEKSGNVQISGVELPIEELHWSFIAHKIRTEYGFLESSRNGVAITKDGQILPRMTYACIEWLSSIDFTDAIVFEYGCGFSSMFWSEIKKCKVHAVEANEEWYEKMLEVKNDDVTVYHEQDPRDFINTIYRPNLKYDIVVIDSQARYDCVPEALECVKDDGMIILDNSDWHQFTKERLDESDLIPIHFHGFKPNHVDAETTSCYLKRDFSRIPKSIIPMGGTARPRSRVDKPL